MKCPMFGDECQYCSMATVTREFSKIKKNGVTGLYDPAGMGTKTTPLGEFCNNDGTKFVRDMHYCPRRWALHRGKTVDAPQKSRPKKERKKAPNKPARSSKGKRKTVKKVQKRNTRTAKTAKRPVRGKPHTARNAAR